MKSQQNRIELVTRPGGAPGAVGASDPDGGGPDAGGVASVSVGEMPKSPMSKHSGKGFIFDVCVSQLLSQNSSVTVWITLLSLLS